MGMPKTRGGVFKAVKRDTRFQALVERSMPPHYAWNHEHETKRLVSAEQALDVQRGVYRSARHLGITAHHVQIVSYADDHWTVKYQLASKAIGRQAVIDQVKRGESLAYNLRRNQ